jgi:hypothetical protein
MSDWQTLDKAPVGAPVKVWCRLLPDLAASDWREWDAIQEHRGWWKLYGRAGGRIYPTHWRPLTTPNNPPGHETPPAA